MGQQQTRRTWETITWIDEDDAQALITYHPQDAHHGNLITWEPVTRTYGDADQRLASTGVLNLG